MSWSVFATGRPKAVKEALARQFESAKQSTKNIPHELESVGKVEDIVNGQLDFLSSVTNPGAVQVSASGSAWTSTSGDGSTQVTLNVTPISGFLG